MSFLIKWVLDFNLMIIEYTPNSSSVITASLHKLYGLPSIASHREQENPGPKHLVPSLHALPSKIKRRYLRQSPCTTPLTHQSVLAPSTQVGGDKSNGSAKGSCNRSYQFSCLLGYLLGYQ